MRPAPGEKGFQLGNEELLLSEAWDWTPRRLQWVNALLITTRHCLDLECEDEDAGPVELFFGIGGREYNA